MFPSVVCTTPRNPNRSPRHSVKPHDRSTYASPNPQEPIRTSKQASSLYGDHTVVVVDGLAYTGEIVSWRESPTRQITFQLRFGDDRLVEFLQEACLHPPPPELRQRSPELILTISPPRIPSLRPKALHPGDVAIVVVDDIPYRGEVVEVVELEHYITKERQILAYYLRFADRSEHPFLCWFCIPAPPGTSVTVPPLDVPRIEPPLPHVHGDAATSSSRRYT